MIKTLSGLENKFQFTWSKFDQHQKKNLLINTYSSKTIITEHLLLIMVKGLSGVQFGL